MRLEKQDCQKPSCECESQSTGLSLEAQAQIKRIFQETLDRSLERYGVNVQAPHEQQTDLKFLHQQRITSESISRHARFAVVSIFVTGLMSLIIWIIKNTFKITAA